MFDLHAPIVPGKSAAGIELGQPVGQITEKPVARESLDWCVLLDFGPVRLWVRDGAVNQIGLRDGYLGVINGTIGIGSTVQQVQNSLGVVSEDDEDNLVVAGLPGCCFETETWHGEPGQETVEENLGARVTEILVYGLAEGS